MPAASEPLACSCEAVSTPSTRVFGDGSPNRGLCRVVSDGVRRLSRAISEGKEEKDDGVDVGVTPTSPGRCRVVEPMASTSEGCGNSVVSATCGEGTVGGEEGCLSNRVCTFRMRSSNTRPFEGISLKKLQVNATYLHINTILRDLIPTQDSIAELSGEYLHCHCVHV